MRGPVRGGTRPDQPRKRIPGGYLGLTLVTLGPIFITVMAVYSQWVDVGSDSITLAVVAILVGAILYFPIRRVDPDSAALDALHHKAHDACFIANSTTAEVVVQPR